MKKRQAIIESATGLFGSIGFDATTTLEIADEAHVTEPLIYYHFKGNLLRCANSEHRHLRKIIGLCATYIGLSKTPATTH